jgi:hypothetical protein
MQKLDHNIGFWETRQFFRRKLAKIEENCDHNIDPRVTRGVCTKNIGQNEAQPIFLKIDTQTWTCKW